MSCDFKNISDEKLEKLLATDLEKGLDRKVALARMKKRKGVDGSEKNVTVWRVLADNFLRPSFVLVIFAFLVAFVFLPLRETFFALAFFLVYCFFVFYHSYASRIATLKNFSLCAPVFRVLRDGEILKIKSFLLVEGDVIFLSSGDSVPFLSKVISSSEDFQFVCDSNECNNVMEKDAKIVSGECKALVLDVLHAAEKETTPSRQGIVGKYERSARFLHGLFYACFALLIIFSFLRDRSGELTVRVFLLFSVIGAGIFPDRTSLFFDIAYRKTFLSQEKSFESCVYFDSLSKLDKLSCSDCVCASIDSFVDFETSQPVAAYFGGRAFDIRQIESRENYEFLNFVASTEKYIDDGKTHLFDKFASDLPGGHSNEKISFRLKEKEFGFDTALKESGEVKTAYIRGNVIELISHCNDFYLNGRNMPLDDSVKSNIIQNASEFISLGCEVVAFAKKCNPDMSLVSSRVIHKNLTFMGFLVYKYSLGDALVEFLDVCADNDIQPILFGNYSKQKADFLISDIKDRFELQICDCKGFSASCAIAEELLSRYDVFLNADEPMLDSMLAVIKKNGYRACAFCDENIRFPKKKAFFDVSCARNSVDLDEGSGSALAFGKGVVNTIFSDLQELSNKLMLGMEYGAMSLISKIAILFLSILFAPHTMTFLQIVFLLCIVDPIAVFLISDAHIFDARPINFNTKKLNYISSALIPALILLVSAITAALSEIKLVENIISVSFFFELLRSACMVLFESRIYKNEKIISCFVACILFALMCVFSGYFAGLFGVANHAITIFGAVVALLSFFAVKMLISKKLKL